MACVPFSFPVLTQHNEYISPQLTADSDTIIPLGLIVFTEASRHPGDRPRASIATVAKGPEAEQLQCRLAGSQDHRHLTSVL